jgi:DNA primase
MTKRISTQKIKAAIRPIEFYQSELDTMPTPRRDHGWADGGLCPFHPDKRAGNFRVNLESGAYCCFSCDAAGGDIIAFTMARYEMTFIEAIRHLKRRWRVTA